MTCLVILLPSYVFPRVMESILVPFADAPGQLSRIQKHEVDCKYNWQPLCSLAVHSPMLPTSSKEISTRLTYVLLVISKDFYGNIIIHV